MNILFLTIGRVDVEPKRGIYTDLIHKFANEGHEIYIATPLERRFKGKASLSRLGKVVILQIKTLNLQQTSLLEKGLSTLLIERQFLNNIRRQFSEIKFDLVLYSTPPITFNRVVKFIKQRSNSKSYLLLKDIFPQNAVDLGLMGDGRLIHRYFRKKEKELYSVSDFIGCMSPANASYLCKHNPEINPEIVHVNPNSIKPISSFISDDMKREIREKYQLPENSTVFLYGGNLGKPQGISFLVEVLHSFLNFHGIFFLIIGSGTESLKLKLWFKMNNPENALFLTEFPKHEYDLIVQSSDVGMIFLDRRFTIPNFPSRLLPYLECSLPVISATDRNTDLGTIMKKNEFGFWSEAGNIKAISDGIRKLHQSPALRKRMGQNGYNYLINNYTVDVSYNTIVNNCSGNTKGSILTK